VTATGSPNVRPPSPVRQTETFPTFPVFAQTKPRPATSNATDGSRPPSEPGKAPPLCQVAPPSNEA
jgi:hypothetical protein